MLFSADYFQGKKWQLKSVSESALFNNQNIFLIDIRAFALGKTNYNIGDTASTRCYWAMVYRYMFKGQN